MKIESDANEVVNSWRAVIKNKRRMVYTFGERADIRLGAIKEKLAYLHDTGATFLGLLDTRKNHRLEWIIILLILVEILLFIEKDLLSYLFHGSR